MCSEIEIFKNSDFGEIRVAGTRECPEFCLLDVCKVLDLDPSQVMKRLDDGVVTIHPIIDSLGRERNANFVNEDGLYDAILDSRRLKAKKFRKWITSEVVPSIRKTGKYDISKPKKQATLAESAEAGIIWVKGVSDILSLSNTSKLMLLKQFGDPLGLPTPDYVEAEDVIKSATTLLKEHSVNMTANKFNLLMIDKGYLENQTRPSRSKGEVTFKSLTGKGLQFGENLVSPKNPRETQPQYYVSKFGELLKELGIK